MRLKARSATREIVARCSYRPTPCVRRAGHLSQDKQEAATPRRLHAVVGPSVSGSCSTQSLPECSHRKHKQYRNLAATPASGERNAETSDLAPRDTRHVEARNQCLQAPGPSASPYGAVRTPQIRHGGRLRAQCGTPPTRARVPELGIASACRPTVVVSEPAPVIIRTLMKLRRRVRYGKLVN